MQQYSIVRELAADSTRVILRGDMTIHLKGLIDFSPVDNLREPILHAANTSLPSSIIPVK